MLAMFPGTPYLDQHKGQIASPFPNKDVVLPSDMGHGLGAVPTIHAQTYTDGAQSVAQTQPSPLVLRFAYPFARYGDTQKQTTYVIFGPGQSVPHIFQPELGNGVIEHLTQPSVALSLSAIWSANMHFAAKYPTTQGVVPNTPMGFKDINVMCYTGTPAYAYLPNDPSVRDDTQWFTAHTNNQTVFGFANTHLRFLPPSVNFVRGNAQGGTNPTNWEPAQGTPHLYAFNQQNWYGLYLSDHFATNDFSENYLPARSLPHTAPAPYGHALHSVGSTYFTHSNQWLKP